MDTVLVPLQDPDALEVHHTVAAVTVLGEQNKLETVPVATQPVAVSYHVEGQVVTVAFVKQDLKVFVAVCGLPYVVVIEFTAEQPLVSEVPICEQNCVVASVRHDWVVIVPVRVLHDDVDELDEEDEEDVVDDDPAGVEEFENVVVSGKYVRVCGTT